MILKVQKLYKDYKVKLSLFSKETSLRALRDISFELRQGRTLGIVGESGCGKSTLAKVLTIIENKEGGDISLDGLNLDQVVREKKTLDWYKKIQMVFQDPYQSLNPRKRVWEIIADPKIINEGCTETEAKEAAIMLMEKVGLRREIADRYPHQFSGGQRQRIGIARALMLNPKVLILDEPVSALDVSVQAQVLNLLMELQKEFNLSYLFISHDLSVIQHVSDDILVMYLGEIVEYGPRDEVFKNPKHPYTKMLLASAPKISKDVSLKDIDIHGEIPTLFDLPKGCAFFSRCPYATDNCRMNLPPLELAYGRKVRCFEVHNIL